MLCKHFPNRNVPIIYHKNETFTSLQKDHFTIILVRSGYGVLAINGKTIYISGSGILFLHDKDSLEAINIDNLEAVSVSFHPSFININLSWEMIYSDNYANLCNTYFYPDFILFTARTQTYIGYTPLDAKICNSLGAFFDGIELQCENQPTNSWTCQIRSYLLSIFYETETVCNQIFHLTPSTPTSYNQIKYYIDIHLIDDVTLDEVCDRFNINRTSLNKIFKQLTGQTVGQYTLLKRLDLVREVLLFTELPIQDIAKMYNFTYTSYLTKIFRKYFGMSPLEYRKVMVQKRKEEMNPH